MSRGQVETTEKCPILCRFSSDPGTFGAKSRLRLKLSTSSPIKRMPVPRSFLNLPLGLLVLPAYPCFLDHTLGHGLIHENASTHHSSIHGLHVSCIFL
jgi:hypothetical protein